jgi:dCMP deaminase
MDQALQIGSWSKDRSRGVGCVIVGSANQILSHGYNGFPRGVNDDVDARHERPAKYAWTEHAERNAIFNAARTGTALEGAVMYLPWFPCCDCARAIAQAGIATLVALPHSVHEPRWGGQFAVSDQILGEAGVVVRLVEGSTA